MCVATLSMAACDGGDAAPADAGPPDAYAGNTFVEVTVGKASFTDEPYVTLVFAPEGYSCCDDTWLWPHPGECVRGNDTSTCDPSCPATGCFDAVEVRRAGTVLLARAPFPPYPRPGVVELSVPGLFDAPGTEIELYGCPAPLIIALPPSTPPSPALTGALVYGEDLRLSWAPGPSESSMFVSESSLGGLRCHVPSGDTTTWFDRATSGEFSFTVRTAPESSQGIAAWAAASAIESLRVSITVPEYDPQAGDWSVAADGPGAVVRWRQGGIEGHVDFGLLVHLAAPTAGTLAQLTAYGALVGSAVTFIVFTEGSSTDELRWTDGVGTIWLGAVPHGTATLDPLDVGGGNGTVELHFASITLVAEDDPSRTLTLEDLRFSAWPGVIAEVLLP